MASMSLLESLLFTLMSPFHEGWNVDCMSKEDQVFDGICVLDSICMSASSVQLVRLWSMVSTEAVKCVVWVKEREVWSGGGDCVFCQQRLSSTDTSTLGSFHLLKCRSKSTLTFTFLLVKHRVTHT